MGLSKRKSELIEKVLHDQCSEEELWELYHLISLHGTHEELESVLERGWHTLNSNVKLDEESSRVVLQKIKALRQRESPRQLYDVLLRVAASVLLLIGSYFIFQSFQSHFLSRSIDKNLVHITPAGAIDSIRLEDGTLIWLNSGSKLEYPRSFDKKSREIILSGEAFFNVAKEKSRPFIIHTGSIRTTVLGTSFNVKAYEGENIIQVAVATGKVRVEADSVIGTKGSQAQPVYLVPGKQVNIDLNKGTLLTADVSLDEVSDWRTGEIRLNGPMHDAIRVLSRRFNKQVVFENEALGTCRIRASYNKNHDVKDVLNSIKYILNVDYLISGDTIRLIGTGCHEPK